MSALSLVQKGARLAFDQDRNEIAHGPLTEGGVSRPYSRLDLLGCTCLLVGARETFDDSADGVFLARLDSHDVPLPERCVPQLPLEWSRGSAMSW